MILLLVGAGGSGAVVVCLLSGELTPNLSTYKPPAAQAGCTQITPGSAAYYVFLLLVLLLLHSYTLMPTLLLLTVYCYFCLGYPNPSVLLCISLLRLQFTITW